MHLSVSNLAFAPTDDELIAGKLQQCGIAFVDLCPSKYVQDVGAIGEHEAHRLRAAWKQRGLQIYALQSLFHGTTGLSLFGCASVVERTLEHLGTVARLGRWLGARILVFGSSKQRDPGNLAPAAAFAQAAQFFARAAQRVSEEGLVLALEAVTPAVGCRFVTTHVEALALVRAVDHAAFGVHLDTATLIDAGEDPDRLMPELADALVHVHASEPGFSSFGHFEHVHDSVARNLAQLRPDLCVTLELMPQRDAAGMARLTAAIELFARCYGRLL